MAIVSEGTFYKARIAPSYVSSSGYYGYVPPCPIVNYGNVVVQQQQLGHQARADNEANDQTPAMLIAPTTGNGWSSMMLQNYNSHNHHRQQQQEQNIMRFNGSAMETDDDETFHSEYIGVSSSRCQNNHCVIPEAAESGTQRGGLYEENLLYRVTERQNNHHEVAAESRRGNRKRNSAGDAAYLFAGQSPAINTKKSRQETVVTATFAMVQKTQENADRPRCIMSRHH